MSNCMIIKTSNITKKDILKSKVDSSHILTTQTDYENFDEILFRFKDINGQTLYFGEAKISGYLLSVSSKNNRVRLATNLGGAGFLEIYKDGNSLYYEHGVWSGSTFPFEILNVYGINY